MHGSVTETSSSGISSDPLHFVHRGYCLDEIQKLHGSLHPTIGESDAILMNSSANKPKSSVGTIQVDTEYVSSVEPFWITGYQKYVYLNIFDAWTLMWDPK